MGEIIISVVIGGCLVLSGIALNLALSREEKKWKAEEERAAAGKGGKA